MPDIALPPQRRDGTSVVWKDVTSIVIVGANGSGKSRMGVWIEINSLSMAHRITAQRALAIPPLIQPMPLARAESNLHNGHFDPDQNRQQLTAGKFGNRWGDDPVGKLLTDFNDLLSTLFGEDNKCHRDYGKNATFILPAELRPKSNLEKLQDVWSSVLPHRKLIIGEDRVEAAAGSGKAYAGRHMSDGERVAFYLIGQVLCAPESAAIVLDEPEIHLHRAIQGPLWDTLERARPDCTFVYITHDLEFAATRSAARKIWVKSYDDPNTWNWEELEPSMTLPDSLVFAVYGSRRPVLFVEGGDTSYDVAVYSALYPDRLVISRQNASKVIEATKAMRSLPNLHHLQIDGMVDRDRRSDAEITGLRTQGIKVADVAEIENLLCLPEAIGYVAKQLHKPDTSAATKAAEQKVLTELKHQAEEQSLHRALAEIQFQLNGFGPKVNEIDAASLPVDLATHVAGIDVRRSVERSFGLIAEVIATSDYRGALRYFNCKGIPAFIAETLGIRKDTYIQAVTGALKAEPNGDLAKVMLNCIE